MSFLRKRILVPLLAIAALAVMGIYSRPDTWLRDDPDLSPLTVVIEPKEFKLAIQAEGELQSAASVTIAVPPVPVRQMRIAAVVPDGRFVNQGDVLVEFDPTELDLQMLEHRSNLEMTTHKISQGDLTAEVGMADIVKEKRIAELELRKINEFLPKDEEIYTRRQIIEGQLDKDYTEKKIVYADARLTLKDKVYSLDEAILSLERQQATAKIGQFEKALTSLKLVAPTSGIVAYNDPGYFFGGPRVMPGRTVYIGMTLFNLVDPEKMEAKCYVLEKDAGELGPDLPVTITLDPFPGMEFEGKVKSVDRLARPIDRASPVKYFQIIVSLDKTDPTIVKPGVKLRAKILAKTLESAIVVPRSALVKQDAGYVAYIQTEANRFEPMPVTLGTGDQIQVVITDGLQPGQILALNPPDVKADFSPKANGADQPKTP